MCVINSNKLYQDMVLLVLILAFFTVNQVTASPTEHRGSLSLDDQCNGNQYYDRFRYCLCAKEVAIMVKKKHIPDYDLKNYNVLVTGTGKQRYYYCQPCGVCEDGREMIAACHEHQDTQCGGCIYPMVYNEGTKACQLPDEHVQDLLHAISTDRTTTKTLTSSSNSGITVDGAIRYEVGDEDNMFDHDKNANPVKGELSANTGENSSVMKGLHPSTGYLIAVISVSVFVIVGAIIAFIAVRTACRSNAAENIDHENIRSRDSSSNSEAETRV